MSNTILGREVGALTFAVDDRSWFKIAKLEDSKFLAINLDPNSPGRYLNDKGDQFIPYELRGPICVCSDATVVPTQNPLHESFEVMSLNHCKTF